MLNSRLSRRPMTALARVTTLAALLAVALPIALFAQNTFATIAGALRDQSGAILPGVVVVATDRDRQVRHQVRTDGTGRFEIVGLPQGRYSLQASLPGFETVEQDLMVGGEDIRRNITLPIGTLQETVSVTGPGGPRNTLPAPSERYKARPANCGPAGPRASFPPPRIDGAVRVGGMIRAPAKLYSPWPVFPEGGTAGV